MSGRRRAREASPPAGPFARALAERAPAPEGPRGRPRRWLFVPYDQLTDGLGPLAREDPRELGVVLVECPAKAARRPYHRQKLALVLANLRQFALEQAARGVAVRHVVSPGDYAAALRPLLPELGPLRVMEPAERELRQDLAPLVGRGLEVLPHEGWLTTRDQFLRARPRRPPWRMDAFYRLVRRETGVLMEGGAPVGGKLSFDAENRRPWRGDPPAPAPLAYAPDAVTEEVVDLVTRRFARHPGAVDPAALPATSADAEATWAWALARCLPWFGPFEDAISTASSGLFHTRVSPLLNLHRLLPRRVLADALAADLPLASREGFVRQVLGWREFVRHVHVETDGLRRLPAGPAPVAPRPGDGGWGRWRGEPWASPAAAGSGDGGAAPSALGAGDPVPPALWGAPSGLACLDDVVATVWREAWSHHITRLMVLGNLATLLDVSPRDLTDWFWVAYQDAYDWVVEPNVLAMATWGAGDLMTTKPYVSGAAYLSKMGDACRGCSFDPRRTCPITRLYWAFLARHAEALGALPRLALPLAQARARPAAERAADAATFARVRDALQRGEHLTPAALG